MEQPACRGQSDSRGGCGRQAHGENGLCIFHLPNKAGDQVTEFERAIREEILHQLEQHPDWLDFQGFHFPGPITVEEMLGSSRINQALNFGDCFLVGDFEQVHRVVAVVC